MRYGAGTRLQVQVSRVDLDARKIDFRLVRDGDGQRPSIRRRTAVEADAVPVSLEDRLKHVEAADRAAKSRRRAAEGAGKARKAGTGGRATKVGRSRRPAGRRR